MATAPESIGAYRIDGEIGHGGMGVVYLGTDTRLGRQVAIKALRNDQDADPTLLRRFETEARTLAALNHPNIGTLHDVVHHEGRSFLVLEYVDGESLDRRLARERIGVRSALEIAIQVADGLAAAHEAGIVHRDLKPANVRSTSTGVVKILDFGLARFEREHAVPRGGTASTVPHRAPDTAPGTILGTMSYMSPEQIRGEETDRRTDLWALGVLLYECLTGSNPFARGSVAECITATLGEEADLERLPASTPPEVVTLLRRCLARDRQKRQRDAGDCALVLRDALEELDRTPSASVRGRTIADGTVCVDDALCRTLDRDGFDSLLPGWPMQYADNERNSNTLIVWVPSIGGDHTTTQWRDLISSSPHRMVIVTPVGIEPGVGTRPIVSLDNQLALIRHLVGRLRETIRPERTIVSGFSCGSIMALRCAAGDRSGQLFDGVLAIDPDLQQSNCFLTRLFARLEADSAEDVMKALNKASSSCSTIPEWLTLHQHMVECVHKLRDDLSPLVRQGRDLSRDYEGVHTGAASPFVGFLRDALTCVRTVRCVFNEGRENRRILGEIRMLHLDGGVLGPRFTDDVLEFLPVADHDGMMHNDRILEQLDRIVAAAWR